MPVSPDPTTSDAAALAARIIDRHYRPKLRRRAGAEPLAFPLFTQAGRWVPNPEPRWSDGFWPGLFWLAWQATGEDVFRDVAARQSEALVPRIDSPDANYDLGFLFYHSAALGHRLTGDLRYRDIALAAARRLCQFFDTAAGVLAVHYPERSTKHGRPCVTTKIDAMMNLTLLWWAYEETGTARFREVACCHARRSLACLLRDDGSVFQVADFDADSGMLLAQDSIQGHAPGSCWARGQAWAIHGSLLAARHTGEDEFADAARRALAFWRDAVPDDGVPPWDFRAPPEQHDVRDASAAAILFAALAKAQCWEIAVPDGTALLRLTYDGLIGRLAESDEDGVLTGGSAYVGRGEGLHGATVWGDYYVLEALSGLVGV